MLTRILANTYVIMGLMVVFITAAVAFVSTVAKMGGGSGEPMPRVNVFQLLARALKAPRRKYNATTMKLVNMGEVKPIPEVPPELERWMARELLRELDGGKMVDEVSLSVSTWKGRWTGTQEQFAALMDKWQEEGIVYRKNKRGDRAFVQPSRPSIHARLKVKAG